MLCFHNFIILIDLEFYVLFEAYSIFQSLYGLIFQPFLSVLFTLNLTTKNQMTLLNIIEYYFSSN